jgi:hypothetical protein
MACESEFVGRAHCIYGTIIGAIFGVWVGTRTEEYRAAKKQGGTKTFRTTNK